MVASTLNWFFQGSIRKLAEKARQRLEPPSVASLSAPTFRFLPRVSSSPYFLQRWTKIWMYVQLYYFLSNLLLVMVFYHRNSHHDKDCCYQDHGVVLWQRWLCCLGEGCRRTLQLFSRSVVEYWEFSELFCESLEDKNVESSVENEDLACDGLEKIEVCQAIWMKNL